MPFPLIPAALALCFLLMWALIAGMIFRDGQLAVRREREWDSSAAGMPRKCSVPAPSFKATRRHGRRRERTVRIAS
jgi:hypothetical protein